MIRIILLIILSLKVHAEQVIELDRGEIKTIELSSKNISFVALNQDRIQRIVVRRGQLNVTNDSAHGAVYIAPMTAQDIRADIFTENGNKYDVVFKLVEKDTDNILLVGRDKHYYSDYLYQILEYGFKDKSPIAENTHNDYPYDNIELLTHRIYEIGKKHIHEYIIRSNFFNPLILRHRDFDCLKCIAIGFSKRYVLPNETFKVLVVKE